MRNKYKPFLFTRHALNKLKLIEKYGFRITKVRIEKTITNPIRVENKKDGTYIAMNLFDETHVFRVVYKIENDIIIIITFYPGRRKEYGI